MELNSKADEIKAIQKFYNSLPADSYLKSILKGMPEYCERQILDDFGISPLETIEANYKDNTDLRQEIAKQKIIIDQQHKEIVREQEKIDQLRTEIEDTHKSYQKRLDGMSEAITKNHIRIDEVNQAYCNANDKANELHKQVIELKAKLYDYMAGE